MCKVEPDLPFPFDEVQHVARLGCLVVHDFFNFISIAISSESCMHMRKISASGKRARIEQKKRKEKGTKFEGKGTISS